MSDPWKNPQPPGLPGLVPGPGPGPIPDPAGGPAPEAARGPSPLADYNRQRFSGYGGFDIHHKPAERPARLNPIIDRLRGDLSRLVEAHRDFFTLHAEMDPRALSRTREGWAVAWRRWALDDLNDQVAETREVYVIYRGDSYRHELFLDRLGKQMLAVQPQEPHGKLRYRRLSHSTDLCDLYGPFARLSDSPLG